MWIRKSRVRDPSPTPIKFFQPKTFSDRPPTLAFAKAAQFRQWLTRHHADHPGIWLKIAKKASGIPSVTYAEALDEALCFGWIDGQKRTFDETAFLQKFTRRGKRSIWSKINVGHVPDWKRKAA